jgi:hypothetical protein
MILELFSYRKLNHGLILEIFVKTGIVVELNHKLTKTLSLVLRKNLHEAL